MRIFVELDITHKSTVLILLTRLYLILHTSFTDLILLTTLLSCYYSQEFTWYYTQVLLPWYYSQDSVWYYSQSLQHHHLNHMRIFVGLDKSTVLILLTRLTLILLTRFTASPPQSYEDVCRTTQVYCLDITHKTQLDITHKLYNITTSIIWGYF